MAATFEQVNPVLPVQDIQRAIDFYVSKLGFELGFVDVPGDPHYAGVHRDQVTLHLQWHDANEWSAVERPQVRFQIAEVDALFDEYKADGSFFHERTEIRKTAWGTREFAFYDPDMNSLTFYQDA